MVMSVSSASIPVNFIEINIICWVLAFIVAILALTSNSAKVFILDTLKVAALVAGGGAAAAVNLECSIFIVSLVAAGVISFDNLFIHD